MARTIVLNGISIDLPDEPEQAPKKTSVRAGELTVKVSAKGAVSVYGLQRWPVTLYPNQWGRLMEQSHVVMQFIADNSHQLSYKDKEAAQQ